MLLIKILFSVDSIILAFVPVIVLVNTNALEFNDII